MRNISIILGLTLVATLVPGRAVAATFNKLVVYGDSLSDLNRAFNATGGIAPLMLVHLLLADFLIARYGLNI
jgi:phospholipase/lecithinase/hemolysin